jgi:hypothetical protein
VKRERKGKLSVADLQAAGVTPGLVMRLVKVPANKAQRTGARPFFERGLTNDSKASEGG